MYEQVECVDPRWMCRERKRGQSVLSRGRRLRSPGVAHRVVPQEAEQGELLGKHYALPVGES